MARRRAWAGALIPLLLVIGAVGWAGSRFLGAGPARPAVADTGVLTEWPLPPNRGPWELTWDAARNWVWLAEGNHSSPPLDQIGALDPTTGALREWGIPTAGAYIHALALATNGDLWFTEAFGHKIGRLQAASNTITEWALPDASEPHDVAVDAGDPNHPIIWLTERDGDWVSSFDPLAGTLRRHMHPVAGSAPHGIVVDTDRSLWIVDTCDQAVAHFVPGTPDQWTVWQPPLTVSCGPPHTGPLFGVLRDGNIWYSQPELALLLRLQPATNTFNIWQAPGAGPGFESAALTQLDLDPAGNVFYTAMRADKIGRLEPGGATAPTVVAVTPLTATQPTPAALALASAVAVYTPLVAQLTPNARTVAGTRSGGIVEWPLSTATPAPGFLGPARGGYLDGGFWVSELDRDMLARLAVDTSTPAPTATATRPPSSTPTPLAPSATAQPPSPTTPPSATAEPASATPMPPSVTPVPPSATPCTVSFSDVHPTDYFSVPVQYLACHGVISGYADGTFRPYSNTTRAQMVKIVVLGFGKPLAQPGPGQYTFADVPPGAPFFQVIETAAADQIVSGYACGGPGEPCDGQQRPYFRPNAYVTRGQLAKIVVVAAAWALRNPADPTFADVVPGSAFYPFVETAACHGIISGYTCGGPGEPCDAQQRPYYRPGANSTRGQIAKIVYGALTGPPACATR